MASTQEPEIQFAQRLASNEKPIRTKAMKKLRKYISVRSGKEEGGFSSDEVLKLWKGLFYCLWMQDKPLLQEELSNQISCLIHSFHDMDGQFLYLESFLQTFKREWTGIDRLRMDKFFQLVRFMFRRVFELLKKKNWDSSVVSRFLELLTTQLLRSGCEAPSGLQFHVLDVFMSELAAVGSAELTANQNLTFIEPFCRTAAKTKDRSLFGAICNSIFSAIIDQAPFAIEDLMKEVKAAGESDSDSGQASEEDEEEKSTTGSKKGQQMNGRKSNEDDDDEEEEEEEDDDDDDDEDDDDEEELLHLEEEDTEMPCDEDVGPVLQFDYTALADKLFVFASRSNTPSHNRQRLYKIIKVLRDLGEGVFPQDEYPEDVSTDEDDDYFGSKKRMKRRRRNREEEEEEEEEEEAPAAKKKKKGKKQEASKADGSDKDSGKDVSEAADGTANGDKKKKKKKKRKKKKAGQVVAAEDKQQSQETESCVSSVKVSEAETLQQPSVTEQTADGLEQPEEAPKSSEEPEPQLADEHKKNSAAASERKKKRKKKKGLKSQTEEAEITTTTSETPANKKKKEEEEEADGESQVNAASTDTALCEENGTTDCSTPAKRKKKKRNLPPADAEEVSEVEAAAEVERDETAPSLKKKMKKKKAEREEPTAEAHDGCAATPLKKKPSEDQVSAETTTPAKKKKKSGKKAAADDIKERSESQVDGSAVAELLQSEAAPPSSGNSAKKKKKKIPVVIEFEADEVAAGAVVNGLAQEQTNGGSSVDEPSTPPTAKKTKKKTKTLPGSDFVTFQSKAGVPTPLFCKTKGGVRTPPSSKKKNQTPKSESKKVTFGLKNNKTAEFRKTDRSLLVSPGGSSRVPFDPQQKPKFGVLKSPPTPLSKVRKIASSAKKAASKPSIVTPKRRASAADFF